MRRRAGRSCTNSRNWPPQQKAEAKAAESPGATDLRIHIEFHGLPLPLAADLSPKTMSKKNPKTLCPQIAEFAELLNN